jgi:hypothetical protein
MCRINSPSHARYADGCTHRKCGWSSCSIGVVVSSMSLRTRNSRSAVRASARVQCRTSWILRTPSACRPCSVSTGPRFTSASQRSCSCSGDIGQVYNARNTSSGADHFRAAPTMMRDVTFPPVTKHHNTSIQRKRFAAVQGSSRSPLMKKGSMSLYSRIFTVAPLGAFPCAIARNAFSDCATIARARSFLWIE